MRIGIDARLYGAARQGLGRYTASLITQLARIDHRNEYFIFTHPASRIQMPGNFKIIRTKIQWYGWYEQLLWPFILNKYRLDCMHFTHFNVPILYRKKSIVTIHDLILLHQKKSSHLSTLQPLYFKLKYYAYQVVVKSALRHAWRVITVSDYAKQDIIRRVPQAASKIEVIYEGATISVDAAGRDASDMVHIPTDRFILYVGSAYPHKNLEFLIRNFSKFRLSHPEFYLVLVGKKDYFYARLADWAAQHTFQHVVFTGAISDAALEVLYKTATAFAFPSLDEGFGLPPLEAMQYGLPVLASDAGSLPEVLGGAALYFNPSDDHSFITQLNRIISDGQLRLHLTTVGKKQAAGYSWERMAARTLELYQRASNEYNRVA